MEGMLISPSEGRAITDLVTRGGTNEPIEYFSP